MTKCTTIPTLAVLHVLDQMRRSAQGRHFTQAKDPGKNQRIRRGYLTAIEELQSAVAKMERESFDEP